MIKESNPCYIAYNESKCEFGIGYENGVCFILNKEMIENLELTKNGEEKEINKSSLNNNSEMDFEGYIPAIKKSVTNICFTDDGKYITVVNEERISLYTRRTGKLFKKSVQIKIHNLIFTKFIDHSLLFIGRNDWMIIENFTEKLGGGKTRKENNKFVVDRVKVSKYSNMCIKDNNDGKILNLKLINKIGLIGEFTLEVSN